MTISKQEPSSLFSSISISSTTITARVPLTEVIKGRSPLGLEYSISIKYSGPISFYQSSFSQSQHYWLPNKSPQNQSWSLFWKWNIWKQVFFICFCFIVIESVIHGKQFFHLTTKHFQTFKTSTYKHLHIRWNTQQQLSAVCTADIKLTGIMRWF